MTVLFQKISPTPQHAEARGRAHGRVRVALGELQAVGGQAVEHGRHGAESGIAAAVAAQVGIAEVVGDDEDDVRAGW